MNRSLSVMSQTKNKNRYYNDHRQFVRIVLLSSMMLFIIRHTNNSKNSSNRLRSSVFRTTTAYSIQQPHRQRHGRNYVNCNPKSIAESRQQQQLFHPIYQQSLFHRRGIATLSSSTLLLLSSSFNVDENGRNVRRRSTNDNSRQNNNDDEYDDEDKWENYVNKNNDNDDDDRLYNTPLTPSSLPQQRQPQTPRRNTNNKVNTRRNNNADNSWDDFNPFNTAESSSNNDNNDSNYNKKYNDRSRSSNRIVGTPFTGYERKPSNNEDPYRGSNRSNNNFNSNRSNNGRISDRFDNNSRSRTPSFRGPKSYNNNNNNNDNNSNDRNRNIRNRDNKSTFDRDRKTDTENKINMNAFETSNLVHLYGIASVLNALEANKRNFQPRKSTFIRNNNIDLDDDDDDNDDEYEYDRIPRENQIKPEAQLTPYLFIQDTKQSSGSTRTTDKTQQVNRIVQLADERNIPIHYVDKGVLNTLSGNRPHQGYVLRCGTYEFEPITQLSTVDEDNEFATTSSQQLWLVLDEVVDPQNLGALLRSAYFLGNTKVLVCAKNSAPPSATVSAASAGALELSTVYSTANLPKILASAEQQGYRIIGASATGVENSDIPIYDLQTLPTTESSSSTKATVLVLGSEGRGLRHLVARSCTEFVRIPGGGINPKINDNTNDGKSLAGVDSLNVSVTGGILLWHLLQQLQQPKV